MNIQPTSQNNPNFEKLYAPKKLKMFPRNISRKQLLEMPAIKENIDRFDLVFEPRKQYKGGARRINTIPYETIGGAIIGTAFACLVRFGLCFGIAGSFGIGAFFGLTGSMAISVMIDKISNTRAFRESYWDYTLSAKKKYADGTEVKADSHICCQEKDISVNMKTIIAQLKNADKLTFWQTISKNYPENREFDAKSILKILKSENIKNDFANGEAFNYGINADGHDTLLTKFFELSKAEENTKEYDEIISIIKSTSNVNFNQIDAVGISILENILNMENSKALELVKDIEFEHTDYLDSLFNNIQDENFKAQAKKLKIKFKDPVKILQETRRLKDFEDAALVQLNSPFCDAHKVGFDLWKRIFASYRNRKDVLPAVNSILYNYLPENLRMDV